MGIKKEMDPSLLRQLLTYEPETGKLYWCERPRGMFKSDRSCRSWNTRFAGNEAFTAKLTGYHQGAVLGGRFLAHRVIWAMVHGEWPNEIDHINGDRADNRLVNLRSVSHSENGRNQRPPTTNTSGVVGVRRHGGAGVWRACIRVSGRNKHLGSFKSMEDAIRARRAAEQAHGYHGTMGGGHD